MQTGETADQDKEDDASGQSSSGSHKQENKAVAPAYEGASWEYTPASADKNGNGHAPVSPAQPVSWKASEYVARHKNAGWFLIATLAIVGITAITYLITRDMVATVATAVIGISFTAFAARPPRMLEYSVDNTGIHIGQRSYLYGDFQSFSIIEEDAVHSILIMPMRRFGLPLMVHYEPADEARIVQILGGHLPLEERQLPAVDRLMTKIHF